MHKTICIGIALLPALAAPVYAQDAWPTRAVRLVVPSSPGGGSDFYARLLAQGLAQALKQQFIVDNRPGGSGNIGAELAARAPADGYTFLVASSTSLVINPSLYKNLPYNADRDFTAVTRGVISPIVVTSHPSVPVTKFGALVALGKRDAGKLAYGTGGSGTPGNLVVKMIEQASGVQFLHIPYKGVGQAIQGVLRGDTAFMLGDVGSMLPHIRSNRVRALAVTTKSPQFPEVPTLAVMGYLKSEPCVAFMVVAPAGTPFIIVQRLSTEVATLMKSATFRERLDSQGYVPIFDTPNEFAANLRQERSMWSEVIRRNNVTVD